MKNLKKLFCILLSLLLLTSCGAPKEENPSLIHIREQLQGNEKLIGVAYLGAVDGEFNTALEYIKSQKYSKVYPFFTEISESHFVQNEGTEVYCVVPADKGVSLSVYSTKLNEKTYQLNRAEQLQSFSDGEPILIRGNISDIMANLMVVAKKGEMEQEFIPSLSLENGALLNTNQQVFDFSPYEMMADFNGWDTTVEWDFYGDWVCTVPEFNGDVVDLKLSISPDGVEYSFQGETMTGSYHGHWMVISDGRIRMEFGGSTQDSKMPGVTGLHTDVDAIYFWKMDGENLTLTYFNGTPFYPEATASEFHFTPAN